MTITERPLYGSVQLQRLPSILTPIWNLSGLYTITDPTLEPDANEGLYTIGIA